MVARILMTGASGFVGPYLRRAIVARYPDATLTALCSGKTTAAAAPDAGGGERRIDGLWTGDPRTGDFRTSDLRTSDLRTNGLRFANLLDRGAVDAAVAEVRPDLVVHLAAQSSVGRAQAGQGETWRVNVAGTLNLALAVAGHAPEATVLFASSSEVYGGHFAAAPVDETVAPCPLNPYARSKAIAERLLADVLPPTARLVVARPFNHTGPGQGEAFVLPSFARQIARIESGWQEPVLRVGNLDAARDFLDVRDVADAYVALVAAAAQLPERFTVNIASGHPRRLRDLLDAMQGMARRTFRIEVDPARLRPSDVPVAYGSAELLRVATGWMPVVPIEQTLADLLDAARAIGD